MSAIEFNNVWEKYRIKFIKEGKVSWEEVWVLEDVSFKVDKGEVLGVIGENGAGKTTLLKLIAGMLMSDKGNVNVQGKVSTLMELGAGFNPEFTGRENVLINARIYGVDEENLQGRIAEIIEFAGLDRFIDAPIKYYSQGMYMRLAFALAIYVEPDILLIDDILAVGDEEAQQKCIKKIFELKQAGKTIILVSHNMNMVSKLCNRVILLERGKIVREDSPQKIIQDYLESVGDKKGIAVLAKGKLRTVFNNGKINISYDDNLLTKGMGGYVSFFNPSSNIWFPSFNLSWQIKSLSSNKIIAEGITSDGVISQIWTLQLEDIQLKWQIEIKEEVAKEAHIDLFLIPQYKEWLTLNKNGTFPSFINKFNWQDLGLNDSPEGILGVIPDSASKAQNFPSFILEREDKDSQIKLFNTGYEQEARIIQIYSSSKKFISLNIRIFPEKDKIEDYVIHIRNQFFLKQQEEKQKLLLKQQEELAKLRASHTIASGHLRLYADLENKAIRLYYKDRELTDGDGLYSSFKASGDWFRLNNAQWRIEKISEKELILTFSYQPLMVSQIWKLAFKDEDTLRIKVEIEVNKPVLLTNQDIILELKDEYKYWLTAYEKGDFLVNQYINDDGPIRLKENKASKVILKSETNNHSPQLFFEVISQVSRWVLGIYKRKKENEEHVCLNFALIIPKKETLISPGRYTYFEGNIILDKDIKLEETTLAGGLELSRGDLKLIFDRGRGKVFWGEKELTLGLGIYTSIRSSGIWYDSYQAIWQINEKNDNKIIILGDWPYIPISQIWQIELIDKNSILWKIDTEIYEELNLEIEQANLMLSSEYKSWVIPDVNKGEFLNEYTQDYDILPFRFWYGKSKRIGVIDDKLPSVLFNCNSVDDFFRAIVENTDYLYKARLLQYQKSNVAKLSPKKYTYFEGVIKIGLLKREL
ncbi:MAG: hypothetical protein COX40_07055 [Candidatus Omnitrophica bacterium CG23_combo_of_CG06-09_8_20_14_all_40_11]|nr:MAG: hypothetical protein COX40_07055 [Candidatus Omnitrophica bacterium CG23_combo_of_CG06-09_8_20_14_all_40_11]